MNPQYIVQLVDKESKHQKMVWVKTLEELHTFLAHVNDEVYIVGDITATEILPEWKDYCKTEPKLEIGGEKA